MDLNMILGYDLDSAIIRDNKETIFTNDILNISTGATTTSDGSATIHIRP